MAFAVGAEVVVKPLANKRGVIVQTAPDGRYRVRVENVTVWCREADVAAPPETKRGKARTSKQRPSSHPTAPGSSVPPVRVDLHGLTVEEALARLVNEIDRAIMKGADRVEVVHGKGSGRIKYAVHRHLASISAVADFKVDDRNPGVTWVYL